MITTNKLLISLVLVFALTSQAHALSPAMLGMINTNAPAPQYFGTTTQDSVLTGGTFWVMSKNVTYSAPISGTITELCAYVKYHTASGANIRVALYSTDATPALICQGDAETLIPGTSYAWLCQTSFTGDCTVTASTTYKLAVAVDSANADVGTLASTSGDSGSGTDDYTGGWPATRADGTSQSHTPTLKAQVTP